MSTEEEKNDIREQLLMQKVIRILKKPIAERELGEIEVLEKFCTRIKFLNDVKNQQGDENYSMLTRNLLCEQWKAKETLFEAGSIGVTFYIILSGVVEVYIKIPTKNSKGEDTFITTKVAEMKEGQSFGELAIIDDQVKPRKATIVCQTNCLFATLTREQFQATVGQAIKKEIEANIEFLISNPLFNPDRWSNRAIEQWMKTFEIHKDLHRGTVLYKEGDICDGIYLVRQGEVVCTRTIEIQRAQDLKTEYIIDEQNQMYYLEKEPLIKNVEINRWSQSQMFGEEETFILHAEEKTIDVQRDRLRREIKDRVDRERKRMDEQGYMYRPPQGFELPQDSANDDKFVEGLVEKGLQKLFEKQVKRDTSVIINSHTAEIWFIPRKAFFERIEGNMWALKTLENMIEVKKERRDARIQEYQNYARNNLDFIAKQSVSIINKDIISLVKRKKFEKLDRKKKVLMKEDPNYMTVLKSWNTLRKNKLLKNKDTIEEKFSNQLSDRNLALHDEDIEKGQLKKRQSYSNLKAQYQREKTENSISPEASLSPRSPQGSKESLLRQSPKSRLTLNRKEGVIQQIDELHANAKALSYKPAGGGFPGQVSQDQKLIQKNAMMFGSFLSNLKDTKYNKYIQSKSKIFVEEQNRKQQKKQAERSAYSRPNYQLNKTAAPEVYRTPSPVLQREGSPRHHTTTSKAINAQDNLVVVQFPMKGLDYPANITVQETSTIVKKKVQQTLRVSSNSKPPEKYDLDSYLHQRHKAKKDVQNKMTNGRPDVFGRFDDRFFTSQEIKECDDNFRKEYQQFLLTKHGGANNEEFQMIVEHYRNQNPKGPLPKFIRPQTTGKLKKRAHTQNADSVILTEVECRRVHSAMGFRNRHEFEYKRVPTSPKNTDVSPLDTVKFFEKRIKSSHSEHRSKSPLNKSMETHPTQENQYRKVAASLKLETPKRNKMQGGSPYKIDRANQSDRAITDILPPTMDAGTPELGFRLQTTDFSSPSTKRPLASPEKGVPGYYYSISPEKQASGRAKLSVRANKISGQTDVEHEIKEESTVIHSRQQTERLNDIPSKDEIVEELQKNNQAVLEDQDKYQLNNIGNTDMMIQHTSVDEREKLTDRLKSQIHSTQGGNSNDISYADLRDKSKRMKKSSTEIISEHQKGESGADFMPEISLRRRSKSYYSKPQPPKEHDPMRIKKNSRTLPPIRTQDLAKLRPGLNKKVSNTNSLHMEDNDKSESFQPIGQAKGNNSFQQDLNNSFGYGVHTGEIEGESMHNHRSGSPQVLTAARRLRKIVQGTKSRKKEQRDSSPMHRSVTNERDTHGNYEGYDVPLIKKMYEEHKQNILNRSDLMHNRDRSNDMAHFLNKIATGIKKPQNVLHNKPVFFPTNKTYRMGENNPYNRKPIFDKSKILMEKLHRSPVLPDYAQQKIRKTKNLFCVGQREEFHDLQHRHMKKRYDPNISR